MSDDSFFTDSEGEGNESAEVHEELEQQLITMVPVQLYKYSLETRTYDPAIAGNLYRVNCSVCHGVSGLGDGKAVRHITSSSSFYATKEGTPYKSPPNLVDSAASRLNQREVMHSFISGWNGPVMPVFGKLLAEEDIRDIVNYIFDDTTGLSQ